MLICIIDLCLKGKSISHYKAYCRLTIIFHITSILPILKEVKILKLKNAFFPNLAIQHVKRLGASNVFLMLGSNLVQVATAVTQFDPTIKLRYKNQRKKECAPSRLT